MDPNTIREAFQHYVLVGCGVGLLTMAVGGIVYGLARLPGRVGKSARKYGWGAVALFFGAAVWATVNAYPPREEKDEYEQEQQRQMAAERAWGEVFGLRPNTSEKVGGKSEEVDGDEIQTGLTGLTGCDGAENPVNPVNLVEGLPSIRLPTMSDYEAGLVLTGIGTGETHDFTTPPSAESREDWRRFGANRDWFRTVFTNGWGFAFGTNRIDALTVFSYGTARPKTRDRASFFSPLESNIGVAPESSWHLLSTNSALCTLNSQLPTLNSQFWHCLTPSNTFVMTWRNVLLDRLSDRPVSFQMEFEESGGLTFRYDLSALPEEIVSNLVVGVSNGGFARTFTNLDRNTTSLKWSRLTLDDLADPDRDGDGVPTVDELFGHHTNPDLADSDADGLADGEELRRGTNPLSRDSDGDGLVDGSDPDPLAATDGLDGDGNGLPDAYEDHWFGVSNHLGSASVTNLDETGFAPLSKYLAGMDPTNGVSVATNLVRSVAAIRLCGAFSLPSAACGTNLVFERTFPVDTQNGWRRFFVSSSPTEAAPWRLEGMRLEWEDSCGEGGVAAASPFGDSLQLPLSAEAPSSLTLRLRSTGSGMVCPRPLYLLQWTPFVSFPSGREVEHEGVAYVVCDITEDDTVRMEIDLDERPCRSPLTADECERLTQTAWTFPSSGIYDLPGGLSGSPVPTSRSRRARSSSPGGGRRLVGICPSIGFDCSHTSWGCGSGLWYDSESRSYGETYEYPLDSGCLWRDWTWSSGDGYSGWCEATGIEDYGLFTSSVELKSNGKWHGSLSLGDEVVWSDTVEHVHYGHGCGDGGSELLSSPDDECESCQSCADGNCDKYEGSGLGSVKFRIPLGFPRDTQIDGFLWFFSDGPLTVGRDTFNLLARDDADIVDSTAGGVRHVRSNGVRGRDVRIAAIPDGVRVTVTNIWEGKLAHTWEITNPDASSIRFRKLSRATPSNVMSDELYRFVDGEWARVDATSGLVETVGRTGDVNDSDGVTELRTQRDAEGNVLSASETRSVRIGREAVATIREVERREWSGSMGCWLESHADYWEDNAHPARNGKVKLVRGDDRAWRYRAYDDAGREILRLDQHDGSWCPADALTARSPTDVSQLANLGVDCVATVTDYTPLAGDAQDSRDAGEARSVVRRLIRSDGSSVVIGGETRVVTRGMCNGYPAKTVETTRLGGAVSLETVYDDESGLVPLVLAGRTASSTDEDGISTAYADTLGTWNAATRTFAPGGGSALRRVATKTGPAGEAFDTFTVTVLDAAYGMELYRAEHLASDTAQAKPFEWRQSLYDYKNRLVSSIHPDGTFSTNAYSCCRLLWSVERDGAKSVRSAKTGEDHLYYAIEEPSLSGLPGADGGFRVTQRFFDGLGRETNVVVRTAEVEGSARDWNAAGLSEASSVETTEYPEGTSDSSVRTDSRGVQTFVYESRYPDSVQRSVSVYDGDDYVSDATTYSYRNGRTGVYRYSFDGEWKWTYESRFSEYADTGFRREIVTLEASDHGLVTNSVTTFDLLGRVVSSETPLASVTHVYDGASSRILSSYDSKSGLTTTYAYNGRGERVSESQGTMTVSSAISYETLSNQIWRVETRGKASTARTLGESVVRTQLTGLSANLRSRTTEISENGATVETAVRFDPLSHRQTSTVRRDAAEEEVSVTLYGRLVERHDANGDTRFSFDALGRTVGREIAHPFAGTVVENRSAELDGDGNETAVVTEYGGDVATEGAVFDSFGREVETLDALGRGTSTSYDSEGRPVSVAGSAAYPLETEYDTAGRKTAGLTSRDDGVSWDRTAWTYDPATSLNLSKTYADGSSVDYTYAGDGKVLRTTWARGAWRENSYNDLRLVSGISRSDGTSTAFGYDDMMKVSSVSNAAFAYRYARHSLGTVTNEVGRNGGFEYVLARSVDDRARVDGISVDVADSSYAAVGRAFDDEARLASYAFTNGQGRACSVALAYDGTYLTNCTVTVPGGQSFSRRIVRDAHRRGLVRRSEWTFGARMVFWSAADYDIVGRATGSTDSLNAVRAWLYNTRDEVAEATVGDDAYGYAYDSIGNRLWSSVNAETNAYAANCLNQYTAVLHSAFSVSHSYDADGNLVGDGVWNYGCDSENNLVSVEPADPTNGAVRVLNAYDHLNRRIRKTVQRREEGGWVDDSSTVFVYDGWNLLLETTERADGGTDVREYFWGPDLSGTEQGAGGVGGLLAVSVNGAFHFPCYDHNGNVTYYVSESGAIAASYLYDAFGNTVGQSGAMAALFRHRFSTKYLDVETGHYYYGRRFYIPALGRWLNRDPIEERGGENLYAFCLNLPSCRFDALGMSCKVGTFNITKNIDIKVKSALYGGDEILVDGKSLLDSLSLLNRVIQASSLYGGVVGGVVSAVDNLIGEGMSPETETALRAIERMMEKLKAGPLVVYGRLEWEACKCVSGKTKFVSQEPIDEDEAVSVEELYTDPKALSDAKQRVLKKLVSDMFSELGKR